MSEPGKDTRTEASGIIEDVLVLYGDNGNKMETTIILGLYWGYIGVMEKKMETTVFFAIHNIKPE